MPILRVRYINPLSNTITGGMIQSNTITGNNIQLNTVTGDDLVSNITLNGQYVTIPTGATGGRPSSSANGMLRYNTTTNKFDGYKGSWGTIGGGATGGGNDEIFYENGKTVNTSYTVAADKNAVSAGPISIAVGVTVTVLGDWTIV